MTLSEIVNRANAIAANPRRSRSDRAKARAVADDARDLMLRDGLEQLDASQRKALARMGGESFKRATALGIVRQFTALAGRR